MSKPYFFLLVLSLKTLGFAKAIESTDALHVAENFLVQRQHTKKIQRAWSGSTVSFNTSLQDATSKKVIAFVFDVKPKGFIIVSPDIDVEPIIAYTFHNNWDADTSKTNLPDSISDVWYKFLDSANVYDYMDALLFDISPTNIHSKKFYATKDQITLASKLNTLDITSLFLVNDENVDIDIDSIICVNPGFLVSTDGYNYNRNIENIKISKNSQIELSVQFGGDSIGVFQTDIIVSTQNFSFIIGCEGFSVPVNGVIVTGQNFPKRWTKNNSPYYLCGKIQLNDEWKLNRGRMFLPLKKVL